MPVLAELRLALRAHANATLAALNDATPLFQELPLFTRLYFNAKAVVDAARQCIIDAVELADALVRHQEYHVSAALDTGASILPPMRRGVVQCRLEFEQQTRLLCAACDAFVSLLADAPRLTEGILADAPRLAEGAALAECVPRLAGIARERVAAVDLFMGSSPLFVAGIAEE